MASPTPTKTKIVNYQMHELYKYAEYTVRKFIGKPAGLCLSGRQRLDTFVASICTGLTREEMRQAMKAASSLREPSVNIAIDVIGIEFPDLMKRQNCTLQCSVGTNAQDLQKGQEIEATLCAKFREKFTFPIGVKDEEIRAELWLYDKSIGKYFLGAATMPISEIGCIGSTMKLPVKQPMMIEQPSCSESLSINAWFYVEEQEQSIASIARHVSFCRLCLKKELQETKKAIVFDDISPSDSLHDSSNTDEPIALYSRALSRVLCCDALTFLHQHAMQNGITLWEHHICFWTVAEYYHRVYKKLNTGALHLLLHEVTLFGACPQRPIVSEIRNAFTNAINSSISHCSEMLLCVYERYETDGQAYLEELRQLLRYFMHIETFYNENAIKRAKESIEENAAVWISEHLGKLKIVIEDWETTELEIKMRLQKLLTIQKTLDEIFVSEWKIKHTDIVLKNLDKALQDALSGSMQNMAEQLGLTSITDCDNIKHLMKIYVQLSNVGKYCTMSLSPISYRQPLAMENCHYWVGRTFFYMYLLRTANRSWSKIQMWITYEHTSDPSNVVKETEPFVKMIRELIAAWTDLLWPTSRPATFALIQVLRKSGLYYCDQIYSCAQMDFDRMQEPFQVTKELCCLMNRLDKLSDYLTIAQNSLQKVVPCPSKTHAAWCPLSDVKKEMVKVKNYMLESMSSSLKRVVRDMSDAIMSGDTMSSSYEDFEKYLRETDTRLSSYFKPDCLQEVRDLISSSLNTVTMELSYTYSAKNPRLLRLVTLIQNSFGN